MPSEPRRSGLGLSGSAAPTRPRPAERAVGHLVVCRQVRSASERAQHLMIRHRVFVEEQAVFAESDLDARDGDDATVAVLGYSDGLVVGTVRLYPLDPAEDHRWQGDRLAVLSDYRAHGVGAPLVRYAVAAAGVRGGRTMTAHIQPANVTFFEHLGWAKDGPTEIYAGLPHQPMSIDLPTPSLGLETLARLESGSPR